MRINISWIFCYEMGKVPFRYLVTPTIHKKLTNKDWKAVQDHFFKKKLSSWKGKLLSYGGHLILLNSILSGLAMYMMSFFEVLKGILKKLSFYRSSFFLAR